MLSGLCQASCIAARRVQRSVSSCATVVALFFLIYPRAWEADQQKCSPFFLSLGHCRTGSLMGLRAEQTGASRHLEKARCTRLSWEFIGDSLPAASVGSARRPLPDRLQNNLRNGLRVRHGEPRARRGRSCAGSWSPGAPCKRPPIGWTLPPGAAPLPVRSPQRRGFSFRPVV
jgi:hypothetical protein